MEKVNILLNYGTNWNELERTGTNWNELEEELTAAERTTYLAYFNQVHDQEIQTIEKEFPALKETYETQEGRERVLALHQRKRHALFYGLFLQNTKEALYLSQRKQDTGHQPNGI